MSTTRSFISISGVEYIKEDANIRAFENSIGRNPMQFSFSISPQYPVTLTSNTIDYEIIEFDIGDYFVANYKYTLWNPNSNPAGNVANALVKIGNIKFDTMGVQVGAGASDPTNNFSIFDYFGFFGSTSGILEEDSILTDLTGLGTSGTQFIMSGLGAAMYPMSNGSTITLGLTLKTGYKAKGIITLI